MIEYRENEVTRVSWQVVLGKFLFAVANIVLAVGACSAFTYFGPMVFVYVWCGLQFASGAILVFLISHKSGATKGDFVSFAATAMPLFSLVIFLRVFILGGSSNVLQFAGTSGSSLWSLWFDWYGLNLIGNFGATLILFCCILLLSNPFKSWTSYLLRLTGFLCAVLAFYVTVLHLPDA